LSEWYSANNLGIFFTPCVCNCQSSTSAAGNSQHEKYKAKLSYTHWPTGSGDDLHGPSCSFDINYSVADPGTCPLPPFLDHTEKKILRSFWAY